MSHFDGELLFKLQRINPSRNVKNVERFTILRVILAQGPC